MNQLPQAISASPPQARVAPPRGAHLGRALCLLAALSTLAAASARAEETGAIEGVVRTLLSDEPLPDATVEVVGTSHIVVTDEEGRFSIQGLAPAQYQVRISFPAHQDVVLPAVVTAGKVVSLDAGLEMEEDLMGQEIVVVGSKYPEKRLESPSTVETVRQQDIKLSGGSSYLAALSNVRGVDYTETGVSEKRISARGFNSQFNSRMLFMVDGRLATLPGNGLPQGSFLPTPALDIYSVDVVVGPASALYGANAHTGVVNVTTKTPWDESGVSVALRGGTQLLRDGAVRLAGTINNSLGWKVNAQLMQAKDFEPDRDQRMHYYGSASKPLVFEGDLVGKDQYDVSAVKAEGYLYYRLGDWSLRGGYGFSHNDGFSLTNVGRNHIRGWQVHYQTLQANHQNWFVQFTRTLSLSGKSYQLDALASAVQANPDLLGDRSALEAQREKIRFVDESQLYDSEVQYRNELGPVRLTTGVQLRAYLPSSKGTFLADASGEKLQAVELGGYAQADYALLQDKVRLVGAARYDTHSNYSPQFSPKLAAVFSPSKLHNIRVGYNRAFKSPSILENYLMLSHMLLGNRNGFVVKDRDGNVRAEIRPLEPERVDSVELGYKGSIARTVYVDVVGYHSWYNNFISPLTRRTNPADPNDPTFGFYPDGRPVAEGTPVEGTLFTYSNFGRARVAGADFGVDYSPVPEVTLSGSYSHIRMMSFRSNDPTQKALLLNVPENKVRGSVTLQDLGLKGSLFKLSGRYQDAYDFAAGRWVSATFFEEKRIPARFVTDVALGYTFENGLSLTAHVYNLFNNRSVDILGATPNGRFGYVQLSYALDGLRF